MKKLLLLFVVGSSLLSCQKHKFENRIQGDWKMKEIKMHDQQVWFNVPENEQLVVITSDSVSNPWNKPYIIIDDNTISINGTSIEVNICKSNMMWASNGDTIKFFR